MTRTIRTTHDVVTLEFTWEGGSYVDVARPGRTPQEVINVWAGSAPRIEFNRTQLGHEVDRWIKDYGRAALVRDVLRNWS